MTDEVCVLKEIPPKPPASAPLLKINTEEYEGPFIEDVSAGVHPDYLSLVTGSTFKELWFVKMCQLTDQSVGRDELRKKNEDNIKKNLLKKIPPIDIDKLGLQIKWETSDLVREVIGRDIAIPTVYYSHEQSGILRDIHAVGLAESIYNGIGDIAHEPVQVIFVPETNNPDFSEQERLLIRNHELIHAIHPGIHRLYRGAGIVVAEVVAELGADRPTWDKSSFPDYYKSYIERGLPENCARPYEMDIFRASDWLRNFVHQMADGLEDKPQLLRKMMRCRNIADLELMVKTLLPAVAKLYNQFPRTIYSADSYQPTINLA